MHTVKLLGRGPVAEGTMAFHFEKPQGFQFTPGQSLDFTLLDPPETDAEGNMRTFSIASAPFEEQITIATRMRDTAFKRVLKTVPLGLGVKMEGPMGSFTLHKNTAKPACCWRAALALRPSGALSATRGMKNFRTRSFCFSQPAGRRMPHFSVTCKSWRRRTRTSG